MPIDLPDDYWIDIPACTFTLGVTPEEARRYGETAAAYKNAEPLPEMDAWQEVDRREQYGGNADYLTEWLLRAAPARTVHIPAYSIARFPVTNALYRRFVEEAGLDPALAPGPHAKPDAAVEDRGWAEIEAFMAWSGHRIPFEDEWERAARGLHRSLFPWGDDFGDLGRRLVDEIRGRRLDAVEARTFAGPSGFVAYATRSTEWCADLWHRIARLGPTTEWDAIRERWARTARGGVDGDVAPVLVERTWAPTDRDVGRGACFRLVKHNGRAVPVAPPMTGWSGARATVREFERVVARPTLESVKGELELHRTYVWSESPDPPEISGKPGELGASLEKTYGHYVREVRGAYLDPPDRPVIGIHLAAVTLESFRRQVSPKHGIFLWALLYRLDAAQNVVAHPVVFYHMAYDRQWHRFDDQLRPGEDDTPIREITPAMIADHVREAFRLYEEYADADRPPPSGRRETRTTPDPIFYTR